MVNYGFAGLSWKSSPVVQSCQGVLCASNEIATYLNPSLGSAKCDYLFFPNEMIERVPVDVSNLTIGKYYRNFYTNILHCAAMRASTHQQNIKERFF